MLEKIAHDLYDATIIEGEKYYKECFYKTKSHPLDENWEPEIAMFKKIAKEDHELFWSFIKQVMVDTVATMSSIIDGSGYLNEEDTEFNLLIDGVDSEGGLTDAFLEYVELLDEKE